MVLTIARRVYCVRDIKTICVFREHFGRSSFETAKRCCQWQIAIQKAKGTFDKEGWLQVGLVGHQNNIGEGYISTGSLYLCTEAFLVLGLSPDDEFWTSPSQPWTQKKIWGGENIPIDHAH